MNEFDIVWKMIKKHDIVGVRHALAAGLNPNVKNNNGSTLLMLAAGYGDAKMVSLLISAGGDPNIKDDFGGNAVADAAIKGHCGALKVLLDNGGSTDVCPHGRTLLEYVGWGALDFKIQEKVVFLINRRK